MHLSVHEGYDILDLDESSLVCWVLDRGDLLGRDFRMLLLIGLLLLAAVTNDDEGRDAPNTK